MELLTLGRIDLRGPDNAARVLAQPKRLAVLAYLAARPPGEGVRRDQLVAAFWSRSSPGRARANLRAALFFLRSTIGGESIVNRGDVVSVSPEHLTCDAAELLTVPRRRSALELLDLYRGEFLEGLHVNDSFEFELWVDRIRGRLRAVASDLAWDLSVRAERREEWITATGHARKAVELAVDVEAATQRLIRLLDRIGDRGAALAEYQRLVDRLDAEFDVLPSPETTELIRRIRQRGGRRSKAESVPEPGLERRYRSLAVLPFEDLSGGPGKQLAMGVTEDLLTALSSIHGLRLISRTSIQRFMTEPSASIARLHSRLGVDLVLEGSVRVVEDRVRVVAQLIDAARDDHLWSRSYDRRLTDVFAVQSEVAMAVARTLSLDLSPREHALLRRSPTTGREARDLYLRGRDVWSHRKPADASRAASLFRQAVALDPQFSHAWVGLADAYLVGAMTGDVPLVDGAEEARRAIERALASDPTSGEARATLGLMLTFIEWDQRAAQRQYRRAVELAPGHASAHQWYGQWLAAHGRIEDALAELEIARSLDPLSPAVYEGLGLALHYAGRHNEAIERLERTLELDPMYVRGRLSLSQCRAAQGRLPEATDHLVKAWASGLCQGTVAEARELASPVPRETDAVLERLVDRVRSRNLRVPLNRLVEIILLVLCDRPEEALDALRAARDDRTLGFTIIYAPTLDRLAREKRFVELMEESGVMLPRWRT